MNTEPKIRKNSPLVRRIVESGLVTLMVVGDTVVDILALIFIVYSLLSKRVLSEK